MKQILVYYLECITDISLRIFVHIERSYNREYICNKKKTVNFTIFIYKGINVTLFTGMFLSCLIAHKHLKWVNQLSHLIQLKSFN